MVLPAIKVSSRVFVSQKTSSLAGVPLVRWATFWCCITGNPWVAGGGGIQRLGGDNLCCLSHGLQHTRACLLCVQELETLTHKEIRRGEASMIDVSIFPRRVAYYLILSFTHKEVDEWRAHVCILLSILCSPEKLVSCICLCIFSFSTSYSLHLRNWSAIGCIFAPSSSSIF